jgi:hypothetical protein
MKQQATESMNERGGKCEKQMSKRHENERK